MSFTRRGFGAAALAAPFVTASAPGLAATAGAGKAEYGEFGIDLGAIDRGVAPGDDFYRHTNNGWLKANTIPADRSSYGGALREKTEANTRAIMESAGG